MYGLVGQGSGTGLICKLSADHEEQLVKLMTEREHPR